MCTVDGEWPEGGDRYKHGVRSMSVKHVFSCELQKSVRDLLIKLFPSVEHMFKDAVALTFQEAKDEKTRKYVTVRGGDMHYGGFPCTDVSAMNFLVSTKEHLSIVESGVRSTGKVFAAIRDFLEAMPVGEKSSKSYC